MNPFLKKDQAQFLKNIWQKKPLFIPNAIPSLQQSPLSKKNFLKLATQKKSCSRVIVENPKKKNHERWTIHYGPFNSTFFKQLPSTHWTLLINDLEKIAPDFLPFKKLCNFIPNWRFDDVMMSYATDSGSVGPHLDDYDVFLIQAEGVREWKIEETPRLEETFDPRFDLKILPDFQQTKSWKLQPGDALYLPPRFAHYGISSGEGMTISLGFRSPSFSDLFMQLIQDLQEELPAHLRYQDTTASLNQNPLPEVMLQAQKYLLNPDALTKAFGKLCTLPLREAPTTPQTLPHNLTAIKKLIATNPYIRTYFSESDDKKNLFLFVQGELFIFENNLKNKKILKDLNSIQQTI